LDNDLVDFAMGIPLHLKLANLGQVSRLNENEPGKKTDRYFSRTNDGKLLLRKVMARYIPREIADAKKQGFSAPDASWFKGESMNYVRREILDGRARLYDYLDRDAVRGLVDEHLEGRQNRRLLIWSLLSFEWWLRRFFT
jgi:asparagine synthase (glutamine-hydrolysing)